jgi:hypothetical protein
MISVRRFTWLVGCIVALAWAGFSVGSVDGHRRATTGESRGMWRVVEREPYLDACVHRRGLISTARTPHQKYGTVVISDGNCGNGQYVLVKPRGQSLPWRILGAGSDWGAPERCASDLRKIPRRVLEDFFGDGYCDRIAAYQSLFSNPLGDRLISIRRSEEIGDPVSWRLDPRGIGPLRLGMSASRARTLVPELDVAHSRFCDSWSVPGLDGVSLLATHARGGLSAVSISSYAEDPRSGHGAGGVEPGESIRALKQRFGKRLQFVKRIGALRKSFYRLYARPGGRRTALEFTINSNGRIEYEEAGFLGGFYYTDGNELCG